MQLKSEKTHRLFPFRALVLAPKPCRFAFVNLDLPDRLVTIDIATLLETVTDVDGAW